MIMYRQIDKIAMGSPLGPTMAYIFVGFLFSRKVELECIKGPNYCLATHCVFNNEVEVFHKALYYIEPNAREQ